MRRVKEDFRNVFFRSSIYILDLCIHVACMYTHGCHVHLFCCVCAHTNYSPSLTSGTNWSSFPPAAFWIIFIALISVSSLCLFSPFLFLLLAHELLPSNFVLYNLHPSHHCSVSQSQWSSSGTVLPLNALGNVWKLFWFLNQEGVLLTLKQ